MLKNIRITEDLLSKVEFIQTINININGVARGKMFPVKRLSDLLKGKEELGYTENRYGRDSTKKMEGLENKYIVLDEKSLRIAPWCEDNTLAMVFYDAYDITSNMPCICNPRLLAKSKIKELENNGYTIQFGVENEFRLFNKITKKPITDVVYQTEQYIGNTAVLPFMKKISDKLEKQNINIDSWNMEYGRGKVKISLRPYIGLEGLDNVWISRELNKYVGYNMELIASYMTKPLAQESGNGLHIHHSLLRSADSANVMRSTENDGKLSEIGKNWLAGLMKHSRALTAFTNPTVNCYRRLAGGGHVPTLVSWDYLKANVEYCVKTNPNENGYNYIENRTASSSCNIYLAIAAIIVAGLDGIKNDLDLIKPGIGDHCECLPSTLAEALDALDKDKSLKEGLGEKFVDWFIKEKTEHEVKILKNVALGTDTVEALQGEFDKYFIL